MADVRRGLIVTGIVSIVILMVVGSLIGSYNGLVSMNEDVNSGYAQIQNVIQRRADLIPNLVETVKGYASHESGTFQAITEARSKIDSANNPGELAEANDALTQSLGRLMVVVENYPELKANENFLNLQDELAGTENRISVERKNYNDVVRAFNTKVRSFPTNIVAKMFSFNQAEYFEADEGSQNVPEVNFGN